MKIQICNWPACSQKFSKYIKKRLDLDIEKFNLQNIDIEFSACMWMCDKWVNVKIDNEIFHKATPIGISEIMFKKLKNEKKNK